MLQRALTWLRIALPILLLGLLGIWPAQTAVGLSLRQARQAASAGQGVTAAAWLREAVRHEPFRGELWETIAGYDLAGGDYVAAEDALQTARTGQELTARGLRQLALIFERQNQWDQAAGAWKELIRNNPSAEGYAHLIVLLRRTGNQTEVLASARDWQAAFPQDLQAKYILALLVAQKDGAEAERQLEICRAYDRCRTALSGLRTADAQASLSVDPAYRLVVIGRWLGNLGEWDLAEEAFQTAANLSPDYAEAWAFLGQARLQNDKDGLEFLQKALQLNPNSVIARALLGLYWEKNGDYQKAIEQMQAASKLEPANVVWQVELGNFTAKNGDLIAAKDFFRKAQELEPENPLVWQAWAQFSLLYQVDLRGIGLPAARRLMEIQPDQPVSLDTLGAILYEIGDLRGAERILQRCLAVDENFAAAQFHLGQVYIKLADRASAAEHLHRAADLDPDGQAGKMAKRLLDQMGSSSGK